MVPRRSRLFIAATAAALLSGGAGAASASAYDISGPNLATAGGARAEVSSQMGGYPASSLNDGRRQTRTGYWNDASQGQFPDWAQIAWTSAQRVDRVVLRMPVAGHLSAPQRTLGPLSVSWWDAGAAAWRAVVPTNGIANPIPSWAAPARADGSELRTFDFDVVDTSKVRVTFSGGNSDGWAFLEEIEVYDRMTAQAPFRFEAIADETTRILQPGEVAPLRARVRDANGEIVSGFPVTFTEVTSGGAEFLTADADPATAGLQVVAGSGGEAKVDVRTGPVAGVEQFTAGTAGASAPARFELRSLTLDEALSASLRWMERAAGELEAGSRRTANDGTIMYTPDGVGSYAAFWTRDFQYMVEGYPEGIPATDVRAGIEFLMRGQRADGAIPDHIGAGGRPQYCAGNDFCGTYGPTPTLDNSQFMVKIVYSHYQNTGDLTPFRTHAARLVRAMEYTPRSPANALTYINPARPGSPYGFTDSVRKTGDQLYDSLLYVEAARGMAAMFRAVGDRAAAQRWEDEGLDVEADVHTLYDPVSGMFLAASLQNRQIDVWGSALAARLGITSRGQTRRIAKYLKANYAGLVLRGQVRHIAPGVFWANARTAPGTYQNGAYWATPSGHVAEVLATVDGDLARQMLIDMTDDFIADGVNEAINDSPAYVGVREYVVSATNPIPTMRALLAG